jgi:hypothetical protein
MGHSLAEYFSFRNYKQYQLNGCFRVYDNLFGKKEEKKEEVKAKVEIREPPKKEYKRKYLGHFAHVIFLTP